MGVCTFYSIQFSLNSVVSCVVNFRKLDLFQCFNLILFGLSLALIRNFIIIVFFLMSRNYIWIIPIRWEKFFMNIFNASRSIGYAFYSEASHFFLNIIFQLLIYTVALWSYILMFELSSFLSAVALVSYRVRW